MLRDIDGLSAAIKATQRDLTAAYVSVSNGLSHGAVVKSNGKLYTWGVGLFG